MYSLHYHCLPLFLSPWLLFMTVTWRTVLFSVGDDARHDANRWWRILCHYSRSPRPVTECALIPLRGHSACCADVANRVIFHYFIMPASRGDITIVSKHDNHYSLPSAIDIESLFRWCWHYVSLWYVPDSLIMSQRADSYDAILETVTHFNHFLCLAQRPTTIANHRTGCRRTNLPIPGIRKRLIYYRLCLFDAIPCIRLVIAGNLVYYRYGMPVMRTLLFLRYLTMFILKPVWRRCLLTCDSVLIDSERWPDVVMLLYLYSCLTV